MMRQIRYLLFVAMMLVLPLSGCGGGGSGSGSTGGGQTATSLSGVAAKGPISGGAVQVFALQADGSLGALLGSSVTAANGTYAVDLGTYAGNVLVEVSGGTYISEATGAATENTRLRAAVTGVSGSVTAAVTPLTEIAVQLAGDLTTAGITSANTTVSALLGGASILATPPADVTVAASANAGTASQNYGLLLAAFAKLVADQAYADVDAVVAAIAEDLADNQLDTTGTAILATLHEVIANPTINQTGLGVENVTIVDALNRFKEDPIAAPDRLQGTYRLAIMEKGFWKHAGGATDNILGANATLTFNGAGGCSLQFTGSEFEQAGNSVNVSPDEFSSTSCSYTVSGNSAFQVIFTTMGESDTFSGWFSADGNALLHGKLWTEQRTDGALHTVSQVNGVKTGTAMNAASLNGSYRLFSKESLFWKNTTPPGVTDGIWGADVEMNFNGAGGCSVQYTGTEFDKVDNSVNAFNETLASTACTYTVAANGALTITLNFEGEIDTLQGWVGIDGNTIISGDASQDVRADGVQYSAGTLIGVKSGTAMNAASLTGTYKMFSMDSIFWKNNIPAEVSDIVWGADATFTFNGSGGCSAQYTGGDFERIGNEVHLFSESATASACTYTVAANGALTIHLIFDGEFDSLSGWLSAAGNTLYFSGMGEDVRANGTKYFISLTTGVKTSELFTAPGANLFQTALIWDRNLENIRHPVGYIDIHPLAFGSVAAVTTKDTTGINVTTSPETIWNVDVLLYDCRQGACVVNGRKDSAYMMNLSSNLTAGNYVFELTLTSGQVLRRTVEYSGPISVPVISSNSMQVQSSEGDSLLFSWQNPTAAAGWNLVAELRLDVMDPAVQNKVVFIQLPATATTAELPRAVIVQAGLDPDSPTLRWRLETRTQDSRSRGDTVLLDIN